MFTRARLRLTILYTALIGFTLVLVVGAVALLAVQAARRTDDQELRLRAQSVAGPLMTNGSSAPVAATEGEEHEPGEHLEREGILTSMLAVTHVRLAAYP